MKSDMSELKQRLLNPYDGAIVEIRKNTEFRHEWEKQEKVLNTLQEEHRQLLKWKSNFVKIFWTIFTTAIGVVAFMITKNISE